MTYIQYCSSHHWNSGFFYDNICLYNTHCNLLQRKGHPLELEEKHNHQLWNIRLYPCHIIHGRCNRCFYSCIQFSCVKSHPTPATDSNSSYFSFLYSSSLTGSSHSLELFSPGTSIARCENHSSGAAPCQCLTPVGILMQSPGFISTASLPSS